MYSDGSALRQLTSDDCLRLLATVPIGRIIYTRQALPAVELVNFALEGGDIPMALQHHHAQQRRARTVVVEEVAR